MAKHPEDLIQLIQAIEDDHVIEVAFNSDGRWVKRSHDFIERQRLSVLRRWIHKHEIRIGDIIDPKSERVDSLKSQLGSMRSQLTQSHGHPDDWPYGQRIEFEELSAKLEELERDNH